MPSFIPRTSQISPGAFARPVYGHRPKLSTIQSASTPCSSAPATPEVERVVDAQSAVDGKWSRIKESQSVPLHVSNVSCEACGKQGNIREMKRVLPCEVGI